jgi:glycosyltransferase involved in cell wall biosynthesis
MRILNLVHQYLPEHVGGTELYTKWLTEALIGRGHEVTVFYRRSAEGSGKECRTQGNLKVWAAWSGVVTPTARFRATFRDTDLAHSFEGVLREAAPDLVHIQHLMGLPTTLVKTIREHKVPYVITLWDFWWVCANAQLLTNFDQTVCDGPQAYVNCARCALARAGHPRMWPAIPALVGPLAWRNRMLRQAMNAASRLIAPTDFVRGWYAAHGVRTENLIVVSPGLEMPSRRPDARPSREGPLRFAYVGGLSWQKGVHVLAEAFGGIDGSAELWIAGDESADPEYVSRLRERAAPNIRFLGKLTREGVWETLSQVDVVAVPSLWYETFSFLVSEAFASGAAVIASRLGPLADRVRDGVDGLLVPPGDAAAWRAALQRFLDEPELLNQLRGNILRPTTLSEHVDEIESLYRAVVNSRQD